MKKNASLQPQQSVEKPKITFGEFSRVEKVEKSSKSHRAGKFLARLGLAAAVIIPPADLALSDAAFAKSYEITQNNIELSSETAEKSAELGTMGLLIMAESLALGQALSRNKKLQNAFDDFNAYDTKRKAEMKGVRKAASKVANAPLKALEKLGSGFETLGNKIGERKTKAARVVGKLIVDAGEVNAVGTSTVIMEETMAGKPPALKRQTYLAGLITGSWLGGAEAVRQVYRHVPYADVPLGIIGRGYETLTNVNIHNPLQTPVGSLAVGYAVLALGYTGWKIEAFRQQQAGIDQAQLHQEVVDFQQTHPA